ncbi:zinc metalloproteinase-disintegrin-like protein H4 subunit A isoform X2 [Armigeres subalbatus]|uniref:zinc metalloproteinase-disintegrin-like protein H4 subunit A isoform X2 n=1 Tax=Armigeres subalbatus TaxID=124917 RepID=UPI002ED605B6
MTMERIMTCASLLRWVLLLVLLCGQALIVRGLTHHRHTSIGEPDGDVWRWQNGALAVNDNGRISIVPKVEHSRLGHDVTLTYNLTENGGAFTVRIELWRSLPSRTFIERQGYGNESILEFFDDECYYQGWVHGRPRSQVAMSTCEGKVRGTVYDVHGTYYIDYDETSGGHYLERIYDTRGSNRVRRSHHRPRVIGPYNANRFSRFVELVLVVDNSLYRHFNSDIWNVHRYCTDVVNHVNMLFNQLNIFIALTGVVVWDQYNHIQVSERAEETLNNFLQYRRKELLRSHPNDHAQLLTAVNFQEHVIGKAKLGGMCTSNNSGAVIVIHTENIGIQAGTLAHEMGHSFNMEHDVDAECECEDRKCIMSATVTGRSLKHWSSCSVEQLTLAFNKGLNHCLKDRPEVVYSMSCGNGFVDEGEECDCGLEEVCDNRCCDPQTCRLKAGAVCATGECCDLETCQLKVAASVCRVAHGECDLPEYCTGTSEHCPADVYKRNTEVCAGGQAYCSDGDCRTHNDQCRLLWGPSGKASDENCYARNVNGTKYANCGYDRDSHSWRKCAEQDVLCGLLFCHQLNENRLEFGLRVFTEEHIASALNGHRVVPCHAAFIDLGTAKQPSLVPDGASCGDNKICYHQQCWDIESLNSYGIGQPCPHNCHNHGVCNSEGNCHCNAGYDPPFCEFSGNGGSIDSGPASHSSYSVLIITLSVAAIIIFLLFVIYIARTFCRPDRCRTPIKISSFPSPSRSKHKLISTPSANSAVVRDISAPKLCFSTRDVDGPQFTPIARLKHQQQESSPAKASAVSVRSMAQPSVGYVTHVVAPLPPPASPRRLPRQPSAVHRSSYERRRHGSGSSSHSHYT